MATARSRRWVNRLLNALESYPVVLDVISSIMSEARSIEKEVVPALIEAMRSEDEGKALAAAWLIVVLRDEEGFSVDDASMTQARRTIEDTIVSGPDDLKLLACYFLMLGGVNSALLPGLKSLLTHENNEITALAAAAISSIEPSCVTAREVLRLGLCNDNDVFAGIAGAALLRIDPKSHEAIDAVCSCLPRLSDVGTYVVFCTIRRVKPESKRIFNAVAAIAVSDEAHPAVRQVAAEAIGELSARQRGAKRVLLRAIESSDWRVVDGAITGFVASGGLPPQVSSRLAFLLADHDRNMRLTAAAGLKIMKECALSALPVMTECFKEERDIEVAGAISQAIAATGAPAIPVLIDLIRTRDFRTTELAMRALATLGDAAAEAIVGIYPELTDATVQKLIVTVLAMMGPQTESAIALLARLLDETDDDDLAMYIAMGLFVTGYRAKGALDALVRCIVEDRPALVRTWAERALIEVGGDAIPALEVAMKSADGEHKNRIGLVVSQITSADEMRFSKFQKIAYDDLERVVLVADVMDRVGATTFSEIERLLEPDRNAGKIKIPVSQRTLLNSVEAIEEHFGRLIDRKQGRKAVLADQARLILPEIRAYLAARRQRLALAFGN